MKVANWKPGYQKAGLVAVSLLLLQVADPDPLWLVLIIPALLLLLLAYVLYCLFRTREVMFSHSLFPSFIAAFLCMPLGVATWKVQIALTKRQNTILIRALDDYYRQRGAYPDSLTQLVPKYFPRVPNTALGLVWTRPYSYQPDTSIFSPTGQPQAFTLSYDRGGWSDYLYSSRAKSWNYSD